MEESSKINEETTKEDAPVPKKAEEVNETSEEKTKEEGAEKVKGTEEEPISEKLEDKEEEAEIQEDAEKTESNEDNVGTKQDAEVTQETTSSKKRKISEEKESSSPKKKQKVVEVDDENTEDESTATNSPPTSKKRKIDETGALESSPTKKRKLIEIVDLDSLEISETATPTSTTSSLRSLPTLEQYWDPPEIPFSNVRHCLFRTNRNILIALLETGYRESPTLQTALRRFYEKEYFRHPNQKLALQHDWVNIEDKNDFLNLKTETTNIQKKIGALNYSINDIKGRNGRLTDVLLFEEGCKEHDGHSEILFQLQISGAKLLRFGVTYNVYCEKNIEDGGCAEYDGDAMESVTNFFVVKKNPETVTLD